MLGMALIPPFPFKVVVPRVKLPTCMTDLRILSEDPDRAKLIQIVHRQCGGGYLAFFHDALDPLMSEYVCTGRVMNQFDCPVSWRAHQIKSMPENIMGQVLSTRLVVEEKGYQRPIKMVIKSNGVNSYLTSEEMSDSEVQAYFERILLSLRREAEKSWKK